MITKLNNRTGEGYEIQFYRNGECSSVRKCDSLEEVAKVLISACNGKVRGEFPTVWYNGELIRDNK